MTFKVKLAWRVVVHFCSSGFSRASLASIRGMVFRKLLPTRIAFFNVVHRFENQGRATDFWFLIVIPMFIILSE
jgi:hypothetical protein